MREGLKTVFRVIAPGHESQRFRWPAERVLTARLTPASVKQGVSAGGNGINVISAWRQAHPAGLDRLDGSNPSNDSSTLAQQVEQSTQYRSVAGSNPAGETQAERPQ